MIKIEREITEDRYYNCIGKATIYKDDKTIFSVNNCYDAPEDASLGRDLSSCMSVFGILKEFYEMGLNGVQVEFSEEDIEEGLYD